MRINKSLKVLFICNSVFMFAANLFGPLYAVFVQKIGGGVIAISSSWAVFMVATTLSMIVVSKFGDRVKEKEYLLAGGFALRAISWLGYFFVANITGLIIVQILLGIGEALGTPSWNVIFAKHLDANREVSDYADWNIISNLVSALGAFLGGILVVFLGFKFLFLLMSGLAVASFIIVLSVPRRVL